MWKPVRRPSAPIGACEGKMPSPQVLRGPLSPIPTECPCGIEGIDQY